MLLPSSASKWKPHCENSVEKVDRNQKYIGMCKFVYVGESELKFVILTVLTVSYIHAKTDQKRLIDRPATIIAEHPQKTEQTKKQILSNTLKMKTVFYTTYRRMYNMCVEKEIKYEKKSATK